jgi:hypothetical protein
MILMVKNISIGSMAQTTCKFAVNKCAFFQRGKPVQDLRKLLLNYLSEACFQTG